MGRGESPACIIIAELRLLDHRYSLELESRLTSRPDDQNLSTTVALVDRCMTKASRRLGFFERETEKEQNLCNLHFQLLSLFDCFLHDNDALAKVSTA
jgi:hypothetical protein